MEINPYAAPQSQVLQSTSQDEVLRKEHINTESTIQSVGCLYYLGAFILLAGSVSAVMSAIGRNTDGGMGVVMIGAVLAVVGVGQGIVGYGLRRLQTWARVPTIVLSSLGLLAFPLGTLINGYILVKVAGKQGKFVMTPEYQQIIAVTPHVKVRTSTAVWVVLAILIIVLIGIWVAAAMKD